MKAMQPVHTGMVLEDVRKERLRQEQKWGPQDHHDFKWAAILQEEVGEAAEASLDSNQDIDDKIISNNPERQHLREELVQVAAVAVAWIEALDRRIS